MESVEVTFEKNPSSIFRSRLAYEKRSVTSAEMTAFARTIVASPLILGKYLNMLSLLEFVGARALINTFATQKENNDKNLIHVLEEARHALQLRKMGERLAGRNLEYDDSSVFSNLSSNYFIKRMIAHVHNDLHKDPALHIDEDHRHRLVILYVSGILEVRAVWWYTILNAAIAHHKYPINFNQVLADEEGHINAIEDEIKTADPKYLERLPLYFEKEEGLFERYYQDQKRFLSSPAASM